MTGQFMMQELAGVPVDVDYASEFEYRNPMIGRGELSIFITQSGRNRRHHRLAARSPA